jgi:fluoroquinolone transport system permease protein
VNSLSFLRSDLKLFFRRGIIPVYIIMLLLYLVLLFLLPAPLRGRAAALLVFTDTSALGFFFVGAAVQWEKRERVYEGLFVTPFNPRSFVLARTLGLTGISFIVSSVLLLANAAFEGFSPELLRGLPAAAAGAALGALFFTFFGISVAVITRGINSYFITAVALFMPFALPVISLTGFWWRDWLLLLPSGAMAHLLSSGLGLASGSGNPASTGLISLSLLSLFIWNAAAWFSAQNLFQKYITMVSGGTE